MKQLSILFLTLLYAIAGAAQAVPNWLKTEERERNYPSTVFITGIAPGNIRSGETKADAEARLRKDALAYVTEAIRVQVNSEKQKHDTRTKTQTTGQEEYEQIQSVFKSTVNTSTDLELTGVKTESYIDNNGIIYGFAYVNKYELIGYHNAALAMNMQQLESILNTAKQMENNGEKAKALTQYQEAAPLLVKIEQTQDILIALDRNASAASVQRDKTTTYRSDIMQALARLSQGTRVYVENMSNSSLIVSTITKALSNECSFPANAEQADYVLRVNASIIDCYNQGAIFFCDADVKVELIKAPSGEILYPDEFSQKGKGTNKKEATDDAFKKAGKTIGNNLSEWLKK